MAKLFTLQFLSGLVLVSSAAALCVAPACTVSSGGGSTEGGAGGEGNQGGAPTSTGGVTSTGGSSGAPAGGVGGEGGTTGEAGAPAGGSGGDAVGGTPGDAGAAGSGGAGGAGGASGKVCTNPAASDVSAKGDTCADYCGAYFTTCATFNTSDGTFADEAECLTTCELFGDDQLCCRAYHVRNASASTAAATTHCPHAAGNSICN